MEILTKEEEESLPSSSPSPQQEFDPRSPTYGITRTPILFDGKKENLLKTVTEKLAITALVEIHKEIEADGKSDEEEKDDQIVVMEAQETITQTTTQVITKKPQMIYEDLMDLKYSTPPKSKKPSKTSESRTPLSCLGNKSSNGPRPFPQLKSSTPIKSKNSAANIFPDENAFAPEPRKDSFSQTRIPRKIH